MSVKIASTNTVQGAYPPRGMVDRFSDGRLIAAVWPNVTPTKMYFYYSDDDGATWTEYGSASRLALPTASAQNNAMFVTGDDDIIIYQTSSARAYINIGSQSGNTLSWTSDQTLAPGTSWYGVSNVVAWRDGTDIHIWTVTYDWNQDDMWVYHSTYNDDTTWTAQVERFALSTSAASAGDAGIDFHHTGDGKTPTATPHIFVAYRRTDLTYLLYRKFAYSAGWTMGTERSISSTSHISSTLSDKFVPSCVYDGTRVVMATLDNNSYPYNVFERDVDDTTTTQRNPGAYANAGDNPSMAVDYDTGDIWYGYTRNDDDDWYLNIYDRSAGTWGGWNKVYTFTDGSGGYGSLANLWSSIAVYTKDEDTGVSAADVYFTALQAIAHSATLTDPALVDSDTLGADHFIKLFHDSALVDSDAFWTDVLVLVQRITDTSLVDSDTLTVDHFWTQVLSDTVLVDGDTLAIDVIKLAKLLSDVALVDTDTLTQDEFLFDRTLDPTPYWVWRLVRSAGNLYITPLRASAGWKTADVVSEPFQYTTEFEGDVWAAVNAVWATHSGSSVAVLKAALDQALRLYGFRNPDGTHLTL